VPKAIVWTCCRHRRTGGGHQRCGSRLSLLPDRSDWIDREDARVGEGRVGDAGAKFVIDAALDFRRSANSVLQDEDGLHRRPVETSDVGSVAISKPRSLNGEDQVSEPAPVPE